MNKQTKNQEDKRAAFRRFSKMGAAGLAVLSLSAFTDVAAQQLPTKVEIDTTKIQCKDTTDRDETLLNKSESDTVQKGRDFYYGYNNSYCAYNGGYCNYFNIGNNCNYSVYSNTYGDAGYSNNYSNNSGNNYSNNYGNNYSNYSNYSNYNETIP